MVARIHAGSCMACSDPSRPTGPALSSCRHGWGRNRTTPAPRHRLGCVTSADRAASRKRDRKSYERTPRGPPADIERFRPPSHRRSFRAFSPAARSARESEALRKRRPRPRLRRRRARASRRPSMISSRRRAGVSRPISARRSPASRASPSSLWPASAWPASSRASNSPMCAPPSAPRAPSRCSARCCSPRSPISRSPAMTRWRCASSACACATGSPRSPPSPAMPSPSIWAFRVVTAAAVRYWIYSRVGVGAVQVANLTVIAGVTFWLGMASVVGVGLLARAGELGAIDKLPAFLNVALGLLVCAGVGYYLVWVSLRRRRVRLRGHMFELPGLGPTLGQTILGVVDLCCAAAALYVLLPQETTSISSPSPRSMCSPACSASSAMRRAASACSRRRCCNALPAPFAGEPARLAAAVPRALLFHALHPRAGAARRATKARGAGTACARPSTGSLEARE